MIKFEKEVTGLVPDHGFTHGAKFHADDLFSTALLRLNISFNDRNIIVFNNNWRCPSFLLCIRGFFCFL